MKDKLNLWTIFNKPADHRLGYVARRFELNKPTDDFKFCDHYEQARAWVFENSEEKGNGVPMCLNREPLDHPSVVETWI